MTHRIAYVQYSNPATYPSLEHSSEILARLNWKILVLAAGSFGGDSIKFSPHENITVRKVSFCGSGSLQKLHYILFCLWASFWIIIWRPFWIYASDPFSIPIALFFSNFFKTKVIYHEHDSPQISNKKTFYMRLILWARRTLSGKAQLCVFPNEQRAVRFCKEMNNLPKAVTIWNCPLLKEAFSGKPAHSQDSLWLLYQGTIVPSRMPESILHALAGLPSQIKLRVIGYETVGHAGYGDRLQKLAIQLGIAKRLDFVGEINSRTEFLARCRANDVGIAFMPKRDQDINEETMVGASNKPFDYLACGVALLVSDLPDWNRMYIDPGYGFACDPEDPVSIAKCLLWFLEHPEEMRQMGEKGRQRILLEWNYEKQFQKVVQELL